VPGRLLADDNLLGHRRVRRRIESDEAWIRDRSKFKAVNARDKNFTAGKIDKRQQQIEESITATWLPSTRRTAPSRRSSRPRPP
jgi:hypothetical protein